MPVDRIKELVQEGLRRRLLGDLTGAAEAWSEVLRLDPGNARARDGLAELAAAGVLPPAPPASADPATSTPAAGPADAPPPGPAPRKNPFARPLGPAPLVTTPSPFSAAMPSGATPLSMVAPADAPGPDAGPPRPDTPVSMAAPLPSPGVGPAPTPAFGIAVPGPAPARFDPFSDVSLNVPPDGAPTLVFGLSVQGRPEPLGPPQGSLPEATPGQTMVFGAPSPAPAAPASPGQPQDIQAPAAPPPAPTMVFGAPAALPFDVPGPRPAPPAAAPPAPGNGLQSMSFKDFSGGKSPPREFVSPGPARPALTPPSGFNFPVEAPCTPVPAALPLHLSEDEEVTIEPGEEPDPLAPAGEAAAGAAEPAAPAAPAPDPNDPGALLLKAIDLLDLDDYSGAMAAVSRVLSVDPSNATAQEAKARCESTLLAMYESKLGDLSRRPGVLLKPDEMVWLNLDHRAGFLLSLIDGNVSFEDVFALSSMSRVETARILLDLIQSKVIG